MIFSLIFRTQKVQAGETLELSCEYESEEDVQVIWYRNNRQIQENHRIRIVHERRLIRIIIKRIEVEDDGEYRVEIKNSAGKTESSGRVTVVQDQPMDEDEEEDKENRLGKKKMKKEEEKIEDVEMKDVSQDKPVEDKPVEKRKESIKRRDSESKSADEPKTKKMMAEESKEKPVEPQEEKPKKKLSIKKPAAAEKQAEPTTAEEAEKPKKKLSIKKPAAAEKQAEPEKAIVEEPKVEAKKAEPVSVEPPKPAEEPEKPKKKLSVKKPAAAEQSKTAETPAEEPKRRLSVKKPASAASETATTPETSAEPQAEPVKRRLSIKKRSSISSTPTAADSGASSPATTAPSSPTSKTAPPSSLSAPSEEAKPAAKRPSIKKPPTQASIPEHKPIDDKVEEVKRKDSVKTAESTAAAAKPPAETTTESTKKKLSIKKKTPNGELPAAPAAADKPPAETPKAASKMQKVPSIEIQTAEEERPSPVKKSSVREAARKSSLDSKPKVVVLDDSGSDNISRRDSVERRDSVTEVGTPRSSRRPSIVIVADEKGLAVDETGQMKKLRPGEMLEVRRGSRRGSNVQDLRRGSSIEIDRADKPSTPLRPIGDEGPPVVTDFVENVTAIDGKTAYVQATVEGKPIPKFKFFKDNVEIFEGGRYKVVTDGETNTIYFCIRKAKQADEGRYKIVAYNEHGEDSCTIKLFVSGK